MENTMIDSGLFITKDVGETPYGFWYGRPKKKGGKWEPDGAICLLRFTIEEFKFLDLPSINPKVARHVRIVFVFESRKPSDVHPWRQFGFGKKKKER